MKLSKVFGIVLSLHVGVILLVMFQPSCQTTGGKANVPTEESTTNKTEESFNQAIEGIDEPLVGDDKPVDEKPDEFAAPKRPAPGELIVPQEPAIDSSAPGIIVPTEQKVYPLDLKPSDLSIYKVVRGDTLWGIARKNDVTLANLLKANPNLDKSGRLSIGQEIMIPGVGESSPVSTINETFETTTIVQSDGKTYTVAKGDTLSRIARNLGVRLSELLRANNLSMSSIIKPGQILIAPAISSGQISESSPATQNSPIIVPTGATTHTVKKGENLSRISSIYGVSVSQIMEWNGLSNPSLIRAGQPLIVSQGQNAVPIVPESPVQDSKTEVIPADEGGSLQDFFNDSSNEDRPIIDAP